MIQKLALLSAATAAVALNVQAEQSHESAPTNKSAMSKVAKGIVAILVPTFAVGSVVWRVHSTADLQLEGK